MVTGLNASGLGFVNDMNKLQERLNNVQQQLSSGLKVRDASDAPDQVSTILQLHSDIQRAQHVQDSLATVKSDAGTADQALSNAISLLDNAQTLGAEGLDITQTAATRTTLASQVDDVLRQMVSISQTQASGRFIFSGDADQTPAYQYNANSPMGVDRLQVSASTRQVQDMNGNQFSVSLSANQIFDARDANDKPSTGNVFAALSSLCTALANNDTTGIQNSVSALKDASSYLNQQQSFYGNVENRVSNAIDDASNTSVSLQQNLSNRQDADATAAIVEMQQYLLDLQAAMAAQAKMPHTTLFDQMQS